MTIKKAKATFVEPMLLLRSSTLPDDDDWIREIKLDGYRAIAFKSAGKLYLHSRNDNDMAARYPAIAKALSKLPDDTVVDGKLVALDEDDRPSFNLLQNYGNSSGPLLFFIFDLLLLSGRDLKEEPLDTRRDLLEKKVMPRLADPIRLSPALDGSMKELVGRKSLGIAPVTSSCRTEIRIQVYRGKIWIDKQDYAVAQIEASPAKDPSFWIKDIKVHHVYAKAGQFWLPATNRSETVMRFGGTAVLTIDYGTYSVLVGTRH